MNIDQEENDEIIAARQIPNLDDNLFVLTKKGMMIRLRSSQFRKQNLRNPRYENNGVEEQSKSDSPMKSSSLLRLPAELIDEEDEFDAMDTDGDGVVTREEFEASADE